jgi:hypothetical protein
LSGNKIPGGDDSEKTLSTQKPRVKTLCTGGRVGRCEEIFLCVLSFWGTDEAGLENLCVRFVCVVWLPVAEAMQQVNQASQ